MTKLIMNMKRLGLTAVLISSMVAQGCTPPLASEPVVEKTTPQPPQPTQTSVSKKTDLELLKKERVNESGEVMIIMYHRIAGENTAYDRTAKDFTNDLERLYQEGYYPISMWDYTQGFIDVPIGKTPVVLTFDDGSKSNFNVTGVDANGKPIIDPNCSVGLMQAFEKKHPDVKMRGIFFLNAGVPFEQKSHADFKIKYLLENGFEIGNHSYGHENFKKLSGKAVEESLGKNVVYLEGLIKKANVQNSYNENHGIYALALPFGSRPAKEERGVLKTGQYKGKVYTHLAILNVGWKPGVSPFHGDLNAESLHRVQCGDAEMQLTEWLNHYQKHPEKRFISDGDPKVVTVPQESKDAVKKEWLNQVVTYEPN